MPGTVNAARQLAISRCTRGGQPTSPAPNQRAGRQTRLAAALGYAFTLSAVKSASLFLAGSLFANAALVAVIATRSGSSANSSLPPASASSTPTARSPSTDALRAALGDDRYAALRRASDADLRTVDSLATRLNLPPNTTDRVALARETYAAESQRINADQSRAPAQRRAQIQELSTRARAELTEILGREAADAYAQRSTWANMLQGGIAYSTNPKDAPGGALTFGGGQSVFPLMPSGANAAGGQRQVVNIMGGSRDTNTPGQGGAVFFAPSDAVRHDVPQSISVITTERPNPNAGSPPAPATATPPPKQ